MGSMALLVLTLLLYGCEVWFLREGLYAKLRTFQSRCCRAMFRITIAHVEQRICSLYCYQQHNNNTETISPRPQRRVGIASEQK